MTNKEPHSDDTALSPRASTVFVDADACPVRDEIVTCARRHNVPVIMVSNGGIRPGADPLVRLKIVAQGADEADKWIADEATDGDIVVTNDIPLAARVIEGGACVLRPDGRPLTKDNIGQVLAMRDLMADIRSANPFHQSSGSSFGKQQRSAFSHQLEILLRQVAG